MSIQRKFKVGDMVRRTASKNCLMRPGDVAKVVALAAEGVYVESDCSCNRRSPGCFQMSRFLELAAEEPAVKVHYKRVAQPVERIEIRGSRAAWINSGEIVIAGLGRLTPDDIDIYAEALMALAEGVRHA